jgi:hypothetical protein
VAGDRTRPNLEQTHGSRFIVSRNHKTAATLLAAGAICAGLAPAAWADPSPPTNGGNGAGQSGQCTGNPDDRPVCPGT